MVTEDCTPKQEIMELLPKQAFKEVCSDLQLSQLQVLQEAVDESRLDPIKTLPPQDNQYAQLARSLQLHHRFKQEAGSFNHYLKESNICSRVEFYEGIQFAISFDGSLLVVDSRCNSRFNKWVLAEKEVKTHTTQGMRNFGRDLVYQNNTLYFTSPESGLMKLPLSSIAKSSLEFKMRCSTDKKHSHFLEDPTGMVVWVERFFKPMRAVMAKCSHIYPSHLGDYLLFTTEAGELGRYIPQPTDTGKTSKLLTPLFDEPIAVVAEGFGIVVAAATNKDHSRVKLAVLEAIHLREVSRSEFDLERSSKLATASICMHKGFRLLVLSATNHNFYFFSVYRCSVVSLCSVNASLDKLLQALPTLAPQQDRQENVMDVRDRHRGLRHGMHARHREAVNERQMQQNERRLGVQLDEHMHHEQQQPGVMVFEVINPPRPPADQPHDHD